MPLEGLVAKEFREGGCIGFGGAGELRRLFGTPLPELPSGDGILAVEIHHELKDAFGRYLSFLLRCLDAAGASREGPRGHEEREDQAEYEELLVHVLRKVVLSDRRQGLVNLFWLAHSREVADVMEERFGERGGVGDRRYQLHPLMKGFYRHVERKVAGTFSRPEMKRIEFYRGREGADSLVRCLLDDQLPLTEAHPFSFDPVRVLVPHNRRFTITAGAFKEITSILAERVTTAIAEGEDDLLEVLEQTAPHAEPRELAEQGRLESYLFQEPVQNCLLRDLENVVPALTRNRVLKKERGAAGSWRKLLESYTDVTACVLRCQVVSALRNRLAMRGREHGEAGGGNRPLDGRFYSFSRHADVENVVRHVVILFGDLRDFTRASEGAISERGLAEELYRIFDPAAIIIDAFGGRMDKYLGDGFMATFDEIQSGDDASLAALRAAVAVQQVLERLQRQERTSFRMVMGLHSGRAARARFLLDGLRSETTPIGRQVNIAGRLSSPGEDRGEGQSRLVREGIAVSGPFLETLKKGVELEPFAEKGRRGWFFRDEISQLRLCFDYIGEGLFKGLEGSLSVYRLTAEECGNG